LGSKAGAGGWTPCLDEAHGADAHRIGPGVNVYKESAHDTSLQTASRTAQFNALLIFF